MSEVIGFTSGAYDLGPHAGHIAVFAAAKRQCDRLIVGLHVNPQKERPNKNQPLPSLHQRFIQVASCRFVDHCYPYETEYELEQMLKLLMPDKRFVGEEYRDVEFTGKNLLEIELVYLPRKHGVSSSHLRGLVLLDAHVPLPNK